MNYILSCLQSDCIGSDHIFWNSQNCFVKHIFSCYLLTFVLLVKWLLSRTRIIRVHFCCFYFLLSSHNLHHQWALPSDPFLCWDNLAFGIMYSTFSILYHLISICISLCSLSLSLPLLTPSPSPLALSPLPITFSVCFLSRNLQF